MQVIALCSIQGSVKKNVADIEPGTVFTATGDRLKHLKAANAVRIPTDDELALAKHRGKLIAADGETAEPTEAEVVAAEKAAAKAAAADADKAAKAAAKKQATAASTAKVADAAAGTTATDNGATTTSAPANDLGV